jgi:hypothetical protein
LLVSDAREIELNASVKWGNPMFFRRYFAMNPHATSIHLCVRPKATSAMQPIIMKGLHKTTFIIRDL